MAGGTKFDAPAVEAASFTLCSSKRLPNAETGWSGERSRKLGASVLLPLLAMVQTS